jgi:ribonuclease E
MLDTERYDSESASEEPGYGHATGVTGTEPASDHGSADHGSADHGSADHGSADASADTADSGGRSRRLFRRGRRAASRPAGPPESPEEAEGSAPQDSRQSGPSEAGSRPRARRSQSAQPPQSFNPFAAPGPQQQPPPSAQPAAQAPLVTFRPPDISSAERRSAPASPPPAEAAEPEPTAAGGESRDEEGPDSGASSGKRRRRGGRGHSKNRSATDDGPDQDAAAPDAAREPDTTASRQAAESGEPEGEEGGGNTGAADEGDAATAPGKRRRRRRRSGSAAEGDAATPDDPPNTVVHVRPPRSPAADDKTDVKGVKGSTRLEAKRQRRREGRESGRRRPPIITESEFLARREAVERLMVVRQQGDRTQIAVLEDGVLVEHYVDRASHQSYVGNVYLGRVQNVLPSMEAAFVDIGKGRNAVLYAGEVNFDASGLEGESKRIESALKSGQSILVQVTKDPIGHKGARLTSQVSLPGRYLVYVPGASMTGISRKLPDTERARLKQILKQVMPEDAGVIVRTAAEGATEEELSRDVARLTAQWEAIERKAKSATAPELLYGEPDLTIRVVRDIFNEDFTKLVIASDGEWDMVGEYVRYVAPGLSDRLERWSGDQDAFAAYRVDEQIAKALERKVWLPSGGSLVIDTTEAMTVIDVNTGKFTGQGGNLEQTVTRNNLEAAEEIVRQLRLRDIGGIIVIDFIDMVLESNRDLVLRRLLECLARDRTKHQVAEVTSLGLVQMTRKRVGSGLLEAFSVPCEHCGGRGVIITMDGVDHASHGDRSAKESASRSSAAKAIAAVAASRGTPAGSTDTSGATAADAEAADQPAASATATLADETEGVTGTNGQIAGAPPAHGGRRRRRGSASRDAGPPASSEQPAQNGTAAVGGAAPPEAPEPAATTPAEAEPPAPDTATMPAETAEPPAADTAAAPAEAAEPAAPDAADPGAPALGGTAPQTSAEETTNGAGQAPEQDGRGRELAEEAPHTAG